ncbi:Fungalysin metallopeptidase-domain-containing protein [Lactarius hatsudake]|nr:Fungalysin metallopeptidase-domain-containing protein [Lactarius hatsudake]
MVLLTERTDRIRRVSRPEFVWHRRNHWFHWQRACVLPSYPSRRTPQSPNTVLYLWALYVEPAMAVCKTVPQERPLTPLLLVADTRLSILLPQYSWATLSLNGSLYSRNILWDDELWEADRSEDLRRPGTEFDRVRYYHTASDSDEQATADVDGQVSGNDTLQPREISEGYGVDGVVPHPRYGRYFRSTLDAGAAAVSFLASKLSVSEDSVHVRTSAQGQAAHHVFLVQKIKGVPVANAVANVAFNDNGKLSSYSSSFIKHCRLFLAAAADIDPSVSIDDAITTAERTLAGTHDGHPPKLEFVVKPCGFAALTHVIQIHNKTAGTWYEAFVDAHDNKVISVTDFVAKASYLVIPFTAEDVNTDGFVTTTDPQNLNVSPNGWHQEFTSTTNSTNGNNVIAYTGSGLETTAVETSPDLNFNYVTDFTQDPIVGTNTPAAITNAFFVVNSYHDFAYVYGFTEATFNFQSNNFNKGGEEYDRIVVRVQDTEGINGADFAVLPDGQISTMRLFLRDSALQNEIIIHESQHGASNRMTGGGTARCFQTLEAGAVAEGYSDAVADALSQGNNVHDYIFGADVSNNSTGLRMYPYSIPYSVNLLGYSSLNGMTDSHAMGEVWANTLHCVYAAFVAAFGWTSDPTQVGGNVIFFHLLFDALLLQPCNPTFIQTRDAWIQADKNRYNGSHVCLLWDEFVNSGLGFNAANYIDDGTLPPEWRSKNKMVIGTLLEPRLLRAHLVQNDHSGGLDSKREKLQWVEGLCTSTYRHMKYVLVTVYIWRETIVVCRGKGQQS